MDEIMDQLNQVIEERVLELKRKVKRIRIPPATQRPKSMSSAWIESSIVFQRMIGNGWTTSFWLNWIYRNRNV